MPPRDRSCLEWLLVWYKCLQFPNEQLKFHEMNFADLAVIGRLSLHIITNFDFSQEQFLALVKIWQHAVERTLPEYIHPDIRMDIASLIIREHLGDNADRQHFEKFASSLVEGCGIHHQIRAYLLDGIPLDDILGERRFS